MTQRRAVPSLIDGVWIEPRESIDVVNPADGSFIASVPALDEHHVGLAVDAATNAFSTWKTTPPPQRAEFLGRMADALQDRSAAAVADLLAEGGKTEPEAAGEFAKSVQTLRYYAGLAGSLDGRTFAAATTGSRHETRREPIGPVAAITPWNVPMASPVRKLAPALLAGNPVIIKPASATPISVYHLAAAALDAGIPSGVVQTLTGSGRTVGNALAVAEGIAAVSFTGSTSVGMELAEALASRLTRVQLELGGKNAAVVLADADLDRAADRIVGAAFALAGQQCTATSRVIVVREVAEELTRRLVERSVALHPLAEGGMGPMIDEAQRTIAAGFVERAINEGATIATGGQRVDGPGCMFEPTVLTGITQSMEVARDEVFGPVLAVIVVEDESDAITVLNDTIYGLSAAVHTNSLAAAERVVEACDTGVIAVNGATAGIELPAPFGGFKMSGTASKEHGPESMDFYTRIKLVSWTTS